MQRTTMPIAAIDEDRNALSREHDISAAFHLIANSKVLTKTETGAVKY